MGQDATKGTSPEYSQFSFHQRYNYTTLTTPTSDLKLDGNKNVIYFDPTSGSGTHVFSTATIDQGSGIYIMINIHATRAFTVQGSLSNVQTISGLNRTISPGGSITFHISPGGTTAIQTNEVASTS